MRGDRVGLLMENGVEATIKLFRLSYTGAIVVPLFSGFGIDAIVSRLSSCGARAIIATTGYHRRGRLIETAGRDTRSRSSKEVRRVIRSIYCWTGPGRLVHAGRSAHARRDQTPLARRALKDPSGA